MRVDEFNLDLVADPRGFAFAYKKGGTTVVQEPQVNPAPPVEEASVQIEDEDEVKKRRAGKGELKIPLSPDAITTPDTGLKV